MTQASEENRTNTTPREVSFGKAGTAEAKRGRGEPEGLLQDDLDTSLLKKVARANSQRFCESEDVVEADVSLAAFDPSNVRAVQAREMRQGFLTKPSICPEHLHPITKSTPLSVLNRTDAGHDSRFDS